MSRVRISASYTPGDGGDLETALAPVGLGAGVEAKDLLMLGALAWARGLRVYKEPGGALRMVQMVEAGFHSAGGLPSPAAPPPAMPASVRRQKSAAKAARSGHPAGLGGTPGSGGQIAAPTAHPAPARGNAKAPAPPTGTQAQSREGSEAELGEAANDGAADLDPSTAALQQLHQGLLNDCLKDQWI